MNDLENRIGFRARESKTCLLCGKTFQFLSETLGICLSCIRHSSHEVNSYIEAAHKKSRQDFDLPSAPPQSEIGVECHICTNRCRMASGEKGFCGLRMNREGRLVHLVGDKAVVDWYYDALPTNCVADWVCPGGSSAGYPAYSYQEGPEYGYKNLAVFFGACSFDCLFCQNWHFRQMAEKATSLLRSADELAEAVDGKTACICYFGGDPTPQMSFALRASRKAMEKKKGKILRICWETNGSMRRSLLHKAIELSLSSGGCLKFDLKAWNETLHRALTGVSNRQTWENFSHAAGFIKERPDPPLLVASTLLVPGYVDYNLTLFPHSIELYCFLTKIGLYEGWYS
ncbi:radical SAM protein [Candidatus Hakubella thermalkaliphila]|uniref:Pyruvate formate lyase activating enzyme n=1 Tax=Candidatus Hakubella thermalkaliphila TaxID=2754717 RepID=A0A6V8P4X3_9ACTN|nr:radical SAM protein [Candidatus Hakubella thermalkaliphila]GFP27679.1 pyruvate formate lyase activating enzyme [Candidatus Hakubella thermalkaliphila]